MFSYQVQLVPCDESTEQKLFCFNYDFKVIKYIFIIKLSELTCLRPVSYIKHLRNHLERARLFIFFADILGQIA